MNWRELLSGKVADRLLIGPRPQLIGPAPTVIGPRPAAVVDAPPRFAWDERRWTRSVSDAGTDVVGRYRVFDQQRGQWREFDGHLIQDGRDIAAYIADPPPEMPQHRHGACLQMVQHPWFRLHWRRRPRSLDDALLYMERMLDEAINQR